jgi:protein arginine kinase
MLDLSLLPDGGVGWLDASGDYPDIVISTRIRLARNLEGYAFAGRARDGERLRILSQVQQAINGMRDEHSGVMVRVDELPPDDRLLLHERHLVSRELAGLDPQKPVRSGAAVYLTRSTSVMVNEEDHLRLQALESGRRCVQFGLLARVRARRKSAIRVPQ